MLQMIKENDQVLLKCFIKQCVNIDHQMIKENEDDPLSATFTHLREAFSIRFDLGGKWLM